MGWAFTGVTLPRLSKVGAGPEIVRLRDLTVVFILTLFRSRVTGEKREGRRKTRKRKGRGSHILSLPHLFPLISHSFGSNSRVAGEKREGGGGGGEKKREREKGEGAFPLSPSSPGLDSTPFTSDACRAGLLFRYGFLSFAGFTTDNFWKWNAIYSVNPIYTIGMHGKII